DRTVTGVQTCALPISIPHKTAVIPFLGKLTAEARDAGAVNTVWWRDGQWIGDNTDVYGVRAALASAKFDVTGRTIVILGAGGAEIGRASCRESGEVAG